MEQLHAIVGLHHGAMLVGPAGCGKTTAWRCLLAALASLDGVAAESHVIDAKAVGKGGLIRARPTTREWHDGALTATIRRVNESAHGEGARHWIVLDGDVDPTWVEALNSWTTTRCSLCRVVSGCRCRPTFVSSSRSTHSPATPPPSPAAAWCASDSTAAAAATDDDDGDRDGGSAAAAAATPTTTPLLTARLECYLEALRREPIAGADGSERNGRRMSGGSDEGVGSGGGEASVMRAQRACATALAPLCGDGGLVLRALDLAISRDGHVMAVGASQLLESTLALLSDGLRRAIESGAIDGDGGAAVVVRRLLLWSLAWGAGGPLPHEARATLAAELTTLFGDSEIGTKQGPGVSNVRCGETMGNGQNGSGVSRRLRCRQRRRRRRTLSFLRWTPSVTPP